MAVTATTTRGFTFTDTTPLTPSNLNSLGTPTVEIAGAVGTLSLDDGSVTNAKVSATAAIDYSKLAALTDGNLLVGNGSNVATSVTMSGDCTMDNTGAVTIAAGAIEASMLASGAGNPVGAIIQYGGSSAPSGWLLCDGTTGLNSVTDTTLADLYAGIGTTYGGTDAEDFDLPDFRGRVPIGVGTGVGLATRALAATGGTEEHTLTTAEIPSHDHIAPNKDCQNYSTVYGTTTATVNTFCDTGGISEVDAPNTSSTGGGGAHENMQPYLVVGYIIKK